MPEINMTFDDVPSLYHKARPRYPEPFFDRIAEIAGTSPGFRVLELGSGTGIATRPMLERGWSVDCIEPGGALAEIAREDLREFPNLSTEVTTFEDWSGEEASYDLIVSATAFHWIKSDVRYTKSHRYLKPGGHLAVIQYQHVADGDVAMFDEIQDCYLAHMPGTNKRETLKPPTKRTQSARDMKRSGLFDVVESDSLLEIIPYTRAEYFDLISTYSGHRMLEPAQFDALTSCIGTIIDGEGGTIRKGYAHELVIGKRLEL